MTKNDPISERRLAENEVFFRQSNSKVVQGLKKLEQIAKEDGQHDMVAHIDVPIQFYCECSNEQCRQRITMKPSTYSDLHKNGKQFLLKPGHDIPKIERVVREEADYIVTEKYKTPPSHAEKLHSTDIET